MELFSVTCITCRTKLKVRHPSAIGQILPCPKCGGMVQIAAPEGWMPPQRPAAEPTSAPVADASETQADDAPLTPPGHAAAPDQARLRKMILAGGGLVAAAIVGFGLWTSWGGNDEVAKHEPTDDPQPVAGARPVPTASPTPSAPQPTAAVPTPTAPAPPRPSASAAVAAPPTAKPPVVVASATAAPAPTPPPPRPIATPTPTPAPTAAPSATKPPPVVAPSPPAVPPQLIDLAARLDDKLPELSLDKLPLKKSLDLLSQLSTIRISYDWDSLADAGVLERPVTLDLRDRTTGEALTQILSSVGLVATPVGDQLLVGPPPSGDGPAKVVEYPVAELLGVDDRAAPRLIELIRDFVAPEIWAASEAAKMIGVTGTKLVVSQSPAVHRELSGFLDRLRLARGKTPRDPATTLAWRTARARDVLSKPVTMNFRPGEPPAAVLAYLETATGATITVDYLSLISAGFQGDEPIGCAADKHPLSDVLTSLCEPREWSWRVVGERTIDLSTREALRRRPYVEFYKLPTSAEGAVAGPALALRIRTQLADEGWRATGGRGDVAFDEPSQTLIVRQHQGAHRRIEQLLAELNAPPAP